MLSGDWYDPLLENGWQSAGREVPWMSESASAQGTRPSSTTLLKAVTVVALVLAGVELVLAIHFHSQKLRAETKTNITQKFQKSYYDSEVWKKSTWLGISSEQTPTDNWSMQEIICEIQPDYIIETGTLYGGTTLYYATVLSAVNPNGKVITIDVEPHVEEASKLSLWKQRVEMIVGSSVDPTVTDRVAQEVLGKKVLVTLDSLHTRDHVLKEMEIYSKMVTPGSYLVVQDTNINGHPVLPDAGPGPNEAVQEFLRTHDNFVVDRSREKFVLTFYPGGWLRRIK
jgi:cephalosporin hydroxylase